MASHDAKGLVLLKLGRIRVVRYEVAKLGCSSERATAEAQLELVAWNCRAVRRRKRASRQRPRRGEQFKAGEG